MNRQPIYLLSTGTLSERLAKEAAERGVVLDVMSFIGMEYIDEITGMEKLVAQSLTVVFTSVHAVDAIRRWLKEPLPDWRVYSISGPTCEAVVALLGEKAVAGKAESAYELAKVIIDREMGRSREIVFFCGDQRREELPSLLRESGFEVIEKVGYRTVLTPRKVEQNYDGIAFFSPSAVESFFSVNVIAGEIPLFAIGPTTAAAIRARCTNPVITGGTPEKAMLIHKMTDHFFNKR
jgi:uroporphyrinogen-III synthase